MRIVLFITILETVIATGFDSLWLQWKTKFDKSFDTNEEHERFKNFVVNLEMIKNSGKNLTIMSPFAHMTQQEYREQVLMQPRKDFSKKVLISENNPSLGYWPFDVPGWIKDCAKDLSCGFDSMELAWDCPMEPSDQIDNNWTNQKVDYRTTENPTSKILVTPIKDQGMCGSCYSFSGTNFFKEKF